MSVLKIDTPRWAVPLLKPARYKAAWGGRGSGKSHFFAELGVESLVLDPNKSMVCIREVQRSLKYSAKRLVEEKIRKLGVSDMFDIIETEIRSKRGKGIILFQGMKDHTAESIKSLEDFSIAWVEEAQSLSSRSLKLLRPTIRGENSELWFSWNPEHQTDPVDSFFRGKQGPPDNSIVVKSNWYDNPFITETLREELDSDRKRLDPEDFAHIWEGAYNLKSDAIIFAGKYRIDDFTPGRDWHGPYHGMDFGFANDPTTATRSWVHDSRLYIEYDAGRDKLELDDTADYMREKIPGIEKYVIRADSARPESISYLKRRGLPRIEPVRKWPGSVEDGIAHIKAYDEIIIHPRCTGTIKEMRLYSYKIDRISGDVLPIVVDANNHYIDSVRYGVDPLIKPKPSFI